MSDDVRHIDLGLTGDGHAIVLLGAGGQAADMATLLQRAPGLGVPAHATELALAANHFAHGSDYRVITDPAGFEKAYRERLGREDAHAEWHEGAVRLSDFGIPDFASITRPRFEGGRLVFFAADAFLGVPYRAETADLLRPPVYTPLPLTPVASPAPRAPVAVAKPLTPAERAARRTAGPEDTPPRR